MPASRAAEAQKNVDPNSLTCRHNIGLANYSPFAYYGADTKAKTEMKKSSKKIKKKAAA